MSGHESDAISLATPPTIHVGPIVTPGCNETISIVIPLSAQLTTVPRESAEQSCKDCGTKRESATISSIWQRGGNAKGCPFPTCSRYGRAFSRAHDLKRHIARHEARRKERLCSTEQSCAECGQVVAREIEKAGESRAAVGAPSEDPPALNLEVRWYSCHVCKKRFHQETKLRAHLITHDKKLICNVCPLCGCRFDQTEMLQNHLKEHTACAQQAQFASERTDIPVQAQRSEVRREFLLEEMLQLNGSSKMAVNRQIDGNANSTLGKIRCDYCSKTFKSKWTLNSHVAAHEGRFQFDCGQCGKRFVRKSHFEGHVRSHEVARPYVCEQCGKTFKELKHRREHAKKKHSGNQNAIQNLLDSISACVSEESSSAEPPKLTLLTPMDYSA